MGLTTSFVVFMVIAIIVILFLSLFLGSIWERLTQNAQCRVLLSFPSEKCYADMLRAHLERTPQPQRMPDILRSLNLKITPESTIKMLMACNWGFQMGWLKINSQEEYSFCTVVKAASQHAIKQLN